MTPTKLDRAGKDFIIGHEGEVLHLYDDPAGFATFGVGHLVARKPVSQLSRATRLKYGTKARPLPKLIAKALSRRLFSQDAQKHVDAVLREVPARWRTTPGRLTALTSISYNLGEGVLTPEPPLTSLGQALRLPRGKESRDRIVAAWRLYDKAEGKTLPGLTRRRREEAELFARSWR
jgi:GH24 family phage-related lysozyme (muramidase)